MVGGDDVFVIADKGVVIRQEWKLRCPDGRKLVVIEKKRVFKNSAFNFI
jgi:hypothetical protein